MDLDCFSLHSRLARRWSWRFAPVALLFCTLRLPVTAMWVVVSLLARYRRLDRSSEATVHRRVARMLSWYPAGWRARYGEEVAPYRWIVIGAMLALGSWMLATAVRTPGLVASAFGRGCARPSAESEVAGQAG